MCGTSVCLPPPPAPRPLLVAPVRAPLTAGVPVAKYVTADPAVHGPHRLHVLEAVVVELGGRSLPGPPLVDWGQGRWSAI